MKDKYVGFVVIYLGVIFPSYLASIGWDGSDYTNNLNSVISSVKGYYGGTGSELFDLLEQEAAYYYAIGVVGKLIGSPEIVVYLLHLLVSVLWYIVAIKNVRSNSVISIVLFICIFLSPRVLDLLIGNLRSALAFSMVFIARHSKSKLKFILYLVGPLIHLGSLMIIVFDLISFLFQRKKVSWLSSFTFISGVILSAYLASILFAERGTSSWEGGMLYNVGIVLYFFLVVLIWRVNIFNGNRLSALLIMLLVGMFLDVSFIRYVGLLPLFLLQDASGFVGRNNLGSSLALVSYHISFIIYSRLNWYI